jgi:hypothetical protein
MAQHPGSLTTGPGPFGYLVGCAGPGDCRRVSRAGACGGLQPVKPVTTRPDEAPVDSAPADHGYSSG